MGMDDVKPGPKSVKKKNKLMFHEVVTCSNANKAFKIAGREGGGGVKIQELHKIDCRRKMEYKEYPQKKQYENTKLRKHESKAEEKRIHGKKKEGKQTDVVSKMAV